MNIKNGKKEALHTLTLVHPSSVHPPERHPLSRVLQPRDSSIMLSKESFFQNVHVYCCVAFHSFLDVNEKFIPSSQLLHLLRIGVYSSLGMIVSCKHVNLSRILELNSYVFFSFIAGIAGGVVKQKTFTDAFHVKASDINDVSANVVSVLQAGAFFGALGSAPISCKRLSFLEDL